MTGWPSGRQVPVILAVALATTACTTAPTPALTNPVVSAPVATASSSPPPNVFSVTGAEAAQVDLVVRFVTAFDSGDMDATLALLTRDVLVSDCDYRSHKVVEANGRAEAKAWLTRRFADHDRLTIGRIFNENPNSQRVVGVEFAKRRSNTLVALGAASGIVPETVAKVVFDERIRLIGAFANGPGGASPAEIARICSIGPPPSAQPSP